VSINNTINMAEMWDTELEDVFVLFSSTLAVATGTLCLHVQLHLLLLHREHQRREEGALLLQQLESRRISDSLLAEPLFYILDICMQYPHSADARDIQDLTAEPPYSRNQSTAPVCTQVALSDAD
jgi:hypothetical protein